MFADPEHNIRQFGLKEGMRVADLGAGSGAYTIAAARAVGEQGKIYAVEVQKDMLSHIQSEAAKAHLKNIEVLWGDIEKEKGTKIASASVDAVILSNVLFQVHDRMAMVREAKRIVKSGGRVLLIDWSDSFGGMGPEPSRIVQKTVAQNLFLDAGFSLDREISCGDHHYGIIFINNHNV